MEKRSANTSKTISVKAEINMMLESDCKIIE